MAFFDHLIIGGGIAGATAAETIRQRDPRAAVRIVGAEKHPVYSRVLLPHVADGRAREERVIIKTESDFAAKGIAYDAGATAVSVDSAARTVAFADGSACAYGKLLIATGSAARPFGGPGAEHCSYFRTLDDLHALMATTRVGTALVYGGGFNAIDLAVSLVRRGARVTCVLRGDGFLARALDARSRDAIRASLEAHGVTVLTHRELRAVERKNSGLEAFLSGGERLACDIVGVSAGVVPNVGFLAGSGIPVADGVRTDERLRVADGVYAAGDVAEYLDPNVGAHRIAGNWMNAMFQGRVAGTNMTGGDEAFSLVTSYSIACFELPISFMGATGDGADERIVRASGDAVMTFFLRAGRMIGVACIGRFADRGAAGRLLAGPRALDDDEKKALSDPRVALERLVG